MIYGFLILPPVNEICGKVIFSQVSVILSTGGSAWGEGLHPRGRGGLHPGGGVSASGGGCIQRGAGSAYNGVCIQRGWADHPPPGTRKSDGTRKYRATMGRAVIG